MTPPFVVVPITPDTPEWEQERRNSIGASDAPNILKVPGAYGTPLEVYYSKKGADKDFPAERAFVGHRLEEVMADWLRIFHPEVGEVSDGFMARSVESPFIHATFDRIAGGVPVQMKTIGSFVAHEWKDGPPLKVQAQVQVELYVYGGNDMWVCAIDGMWQFYLIHVYRDEAFIETALPVLERFWVKNVLAGVEPAPMTSTEAASLWQSDGTTVEVPPEEWDAVWDQWERDRELSQEIRDATNDRDALRLDVVKRMGVAEVLTLRGMPVFSWKPNKSGTRTFNRLNVKEQE